MKAKMLENVYEGLNARSKVYFCKMYIPDLRVFYALRVYSNSGKFS